MNCDVCGQGLFFKRSVDTGRCYSCSAGSERGLVLALADRIYACHEILAHKAERRAVVLTERDACPLNGDVPGRAA